MDDRDLGAGSKDPSSTSGAPFPPATRHSDGPDRPRRDVPTAVPEADDEGDEVPPPTHVDSEEEDNHGGP